MAVSATPTPSGSNIISFDDSTRTVSVVSSDLTYSGNTYTVTITGTYGGLSDSLQFDIIVTDCVAISSNFEVDSSQATALQYQIDNPSVASDFNIETFFQSDDPDCAAQITYSVEYVSPSSALPTSSGVWLWYDNSKTAITVDTNDNLQEQSNDADAPALPLDLRALANIGSS